MTLLSINKKPENQIEITFDYNKDTIAKIRAITGRKWIPERKAWCMPENGESYKALENIFGKDLINLTKSNGICEELYEREVAFQ